MLSRFSGQFTDTNQNSRFFFNYEAHETESLFSLVFMCTDLIFNVQIDGGEKRFGYGHTVTNNDPLAGRQIVQIDSNTF